MLPTRRCTRRRHAAATELSAQRSSASKGLPLHRGAPYTAATFLKEPKGLGHAVLVAERHVGGEPFAVLLGDNIMADPLLEPMVKVYEQYGRSVVALQEVSRDQVSAYGIAAFEPIDESLVKVVDI